MRPVSTEAAVQPGYDPPAPAAQPKPWHPGSRLATVTGFIAADAAAWLFSVLLMFVVRTLIWGASPLFLGLWVTGPCWILFRAASGLYPATGLSQPEVLRSSVRATAGAAILHAAALVLAQQFEPWRLFGLLIWLPVIPLAYFLRVAVQILLRRHQLYGEPFIVIGAGERGRTVLREMNANWDSGFYPVGVFSAGAHGSETHVEGVPVLDSISRAADFHFPYSVRRAVIAIDPVKTRIAIPELTNRISTKYPILQVMPEFLGPTNLLANARSIGAHLVLEMRYARFSPRQQMIKRAFDLAVTLPVFITALPIIAVAALAVKFVSPGPAFFSQKREGLNGEDVRIFKIRTMVPDAEKRLAEYLASDPAARFEYERTLKLRNDPRVIPKIGNFLRRASIDELPQLWSVIRGDMSLVGPRIMPAHEINRYSDEGRDLRRNVLPGLTGFWQIMYRNNSDLRIREVADSYYVNNWSIWLDSWILLRTVRVVFGGAGAF